MTRPRATASPCALVALAALLVASLLGTSVAQASEIEDFESARAAYDARDFQRAVVEFEGLVGTDVPRLSSAALVVEARKYLGAAYLFVGRRDAARVQFERLLQAEPAYVLDPLQFPTEVLELFEGVRDRLDVERRSAEERAALEARAARAESRADSLLAFADAEVEIEIPNSRWLALVPGGVGQFQNGDPALGWAFLASEAVLLGVAVGATAWHQALVGQVAVARARGAVESVAEGNRLLEAAAALDWASLGALGVIAVAGVVEAELTFVPVTRVRRRRSVPDDLRSPTPAVPTRASLRAAPAGAMIGLRLEF